MNQIIGFQNGNPIQFNPEDIITKRLFALSMTGAGKSYLNAIFLEGFCKARFPFIVVDPEGEYWTLKIKFPDVIVAGGEHADIPIDLTLARDLANMAVKEKLELVLDISDLRRSEQERFLADFLEEFFLIETKEHIPFWVSFEEADKWMPQTGDPVCKEPSLDIMQRGRKRGIGASIQSQRPAIVSKTALGQCDLKFFLRFNEPRDLDACREYLSSFAELANTLPSLQNGEAILYAPTYFKEPLQIKVAERICPHGGATPDQIRQIKPTTETLKLKEQFMNVLEKRKAELQQKIITPIEYQRLLEKVAKFEERKRVIEERAEEKAKEKYQDEITRLRKQLDELSRSQALTGPISDVLEHPIVKTRMSELPEKARTLLVKVEKEPGVTREQLAAFLTSSKDTVSSLIERTNQVFRAQVIVGDGKPIRYRSLLKRLYITDVAKREIEELERLQERNKALEEENKTLRPIAQQSATLRGEVGSLKTERDTALGRLGKQDLEMKELKEHNEVLATENALGATRDEAYRKIKEGFQALGITTSAVAPIDQEKVKAYVDEKLKEMDVEGHLTAFRKEFSGGLQGVIDKVELEKTVTEIVEKKAAEKMASQPAGVISTSVELEHQVTHFEFKAPEEHVKADTTTLQGRILYTILKDTDFWTKRHNPPEVTTKLSSYGWTHNTKDEVSPALVDLCQKGIFARVLSTGNYWWYTLQPEAKELIHG